MTMISPKWSAVLVLFAAFYISREHLQVPKHVPYFMKSGNVSHASDLEKRQLVTGFFQASNVYIHSVAEGRKEETHVVSFGLGDLSALSSFSTPASTGVVHFMASTLNFFRDWAEVEAIAQARLAAEPALAASALHAQKYVHANLAYMTADANKLTPGNISALARQVPLEHLLGAPTSMMVSMSGCNATAVADIIGVTVDDTKVELRVRMVDKPLIVSEFEPHPKQVLHGSGNHYHFETVPGVVHDAKAFMEFTQSPAAQGAAVGVFMKGACGSGCSPPPPAPRPATSVTVTFLPPAPGTPFPVVGSTLQLTLTIITNGVVSLSFRTNGVVAPNGGSPTSPPAPVPAPPTPVPQPPPIPTPEPAGKTAAASADADINTDDIAATATATVAVGHRDLDANAATVNGAGGGSDLSDVVSKQGGDKTVTATSWWLFYPYGPKYKTTPILYNPNPLVVSASGTYTVALYFQKAGLYKVDVFNARLGRLVRQRPVVIKVLPAFYGKK